MRTATLLPSLRTRVRESLHLLPVFVGVLFFIRLAMGSDTNGFRIQPLLFSLLVVLGYIALTPLPWQWTGDDADQAAFPRGLLQAMGSNLVWLAALVFGSRLLLPGLILRDLPFHQVVQAHPFLSGLSRGSYFLLLNFPVTLITGYLMAGRETSERRRQRMEARAAELEESERQAQFLALQAQLDPHVLYNALGGIAELVHRDADAAETALLDLSDLLRKLTRYGRQKRVRLSDERTLVTEYLALEALRLGPRLQVAWAWAPEVDAVEVPPLLLQPLVENAVQHGVSRSRRPSVVRISADIRGDRLVFSVANEGPAWHPEEAREGVGVGNLRRRLALLEGASLELSHADGWTTATVQLRKESCHDH